MGHYTHVLVETRLEALNTLPVILPTNPDTWREAATGTTGEIVLDYVEIPDTPTDTRKTNGNGQIRTYTNGKSGPNLPEIGGLDMNNPLQRNKLQGMEVLAWKGIECAVKHYAS